jgi:hypothetical protein
MLQLHTQMRWTGMKAFSPEEMDQALMSGKEYELTMPPGLKAAPRPNPRAGFNAVRAFYESAANQVSSDCEQDDCYYHGSCVRKLTMRMLHCIG